MRKLFYFISVVVILISCRQKQYFNSSPEIDIIKKANEAYFKRDWETFKSVFSDKARVWLNAPRLKKTVLTKDQLIDTLKAGLLNYAEYKVGKNPDYEDPLYEMIVDNEGGKWVHCWLTWIGRLGNGTEIVIPVHLSSHIKENKIEIHFIYYNALPGYLATQTADSIKVFNQE